MRLITPALKGWDCMDHHPIEAWTPDGDVVVFWLVCHVGAPGTTAADMYTVPVVNPLGLKSPEWQAYLRTAGGRSIPPIVVEPYAFEAVLAEVHRRLAECAGADWNGIAARLCKLFHWEYERMFPI
jgi:Immunity protein 8